MENCADKIFIYLKADMFNTLWDNTTSCTVVKTWVAEFKLGRISVIVKYHSGRPKDVLQLLNTSRLLTTD